MFDFFVKSFESSLLLTAVDVIDNTFDAGGSVFGDIDRNIDGKGLGSTIDIGREMLTNDGTIVRHEPILHNAYMTVFLKSGLLGVFIIFYFFYYLFKQSKSDNEVVKQVNLLLIGTAFFLIVANWVLLGLFLKIDNKSIIIGFLLCYKELNIKQNQLPSIKDQNE
jgi:ABC-type Na+ efflux pump permease subunit